MKLRLPLFLISTLASANVASAGLRGGNGERVLQEGLVGTYVMGDIQYDHESGETGPETVDAIELPNGEILEMTNAPPGLSKIFGSGVDQIELPPGLSRVGATVDLNGVAPKKAGGPPPTIFDRDLEEERTPEQERNLAELQRNLAVLGARTVLVVRVVASDGTTSFTEAQLSDSVFGTSGDPVNLKSQYAACSHNQLIFNKAADNTSGNNVISDGAVTVQVSTSTSEGDGVMRNAITSKLNSMFGVSSPNQLANHVMYCLPSGTMSGIAYAYINSWNSVYSNQWCTYVSGQMHELGHNIGLAHSGEGTQQYADQTGMMGYSYGYSDTPVMCFNNAKNWQLGWFSGATQEFNSGTTIAPTTITLTGQVNYGDGNTVVVKLNNPTSSTDHYIGFNYKSGHNSGTVEGGNQVTIQTAGGEGSNYATSTLVAKLNAGGTYPVIIGEVTNTIAVESIAGGTAVITINGGGGPTPPPTTAPPTPPPTPPPTNQPTTAQPTDQPTPPPTPSPTVSAAPSKAPSKNPTKAPSPSPTGQPTFPPAPKYLCQNSDATDEAICQTGEFLGVGSEGDKCTPSAIDGVTSCGNGNSGKFCRIASCPGTGPAPSPPSPTPEPAPTPNPPSPTPQCGTGGHNEACSANSDCLSCTCNGGNGKCTKP